MSKFKVDKYFLESGLLYYCDISLGEIQDDKEYGESFGGEKILNRINLKLNQAIDDKSNKKDWAWIEIEYDELGWYDYWLEHYQLGEFKYIHQDILEDPNEIAYNGCDYFAESKKTCRKLRQAFNDKIQNAKEYFEVI